MNNRFHGLIASVLLALVLVPSLLVAQPFDPRGHGPGGRGGGFFGHGMMIERMAERLDLTAEQRDAIDAIFEAYRGDLGEQRQAVHELERALAEQIHAEALDEGTIRSLGAELGGASAELAITRGRMAQEVRDVLTPEQQAEAREMFEKRREFGRQRAERFRNRTAPDGE